jgi:uncharacterized protein
MKFHLSELRVHKSLQQSGEFDPVLLLGPAPALVTYTTPIKANVQADLIQAEILITGSAQTEIQNTCSLCLAIFNQPIGGQFRQSVDEDVDVIDVDEFIKESVLLDLPLKALCKPNCKGLCPVCGNNKNETDCGCRIDAGSPAWKALKDFKVN